MPIMIMFYHDSLPSLNYALSNNALFERNHDNAESFLIQAHST
jgi:hypothetical protein